MIAAVLKFYLCLNACKTIAKLSVTDAYTAQYVVHKAVYACRLFFEDLKFVAFRRQQKALKQFNDPWLEVEIEPSKQRVQNCKP